MTYTTKACDTSHRFTRFCGAFLTIALMTLPVAAVPLSQAPVNLGTAGDFVILAKTGISATGVTSIVGNIGVCPVAATYVTGFDLIADVSNSFWTSSLVAGKVYAADNIDPTPVKMISAVGDMETAYTNAAGRIIPDYTELYTGDLTGRTLTAGLYTWSTGVLISAGGVNISGTATDIWIFQIAQNLEFASGAIITLSGGARASNIFWQVAGQVTLGTTANMSGIVLCKTAIVMNAGATLLGRALAQTAVTLDANSIVETPNATSVKSVFVPQNKPSLHINSNQSIEFTVPSSGKIILTILNPLGQKVATLFSGKAEAGKLNKVQFNSINLSKGLYFSKLTCDGNTILKRLLVI
jgi:hypothetical protein